MATSDLTYRQLLGRIADRLKAMAEPTRLQLLHELEGREVCVSELVERLGCSQANVSKHLGVLRAAGLVRCRRKGLNVYYTIEDQGVFEVCRLMCGCIERQASREVAEIGEAAGSLAARKGN
ncbi:MAG TPA: metalloregulator ArsR/SmtB family transcription factor [Thermoanaerobaculia bacterium]|nr:metalloregulator ArsR/SmtB family transcription factor [Thermoanaerobaculia bacterium]